VFAEYDLKHNIDILHAVVTEARSRKQSGLIGNDVWREDLSPKAAVRARTVPLLEKEAMRLRATLDEVQSLHFVIDYCLTSVLILQMEKENIQLQAQVYRNVTECKEAEDKTAELLDIFDEVRPSVCPSRTSL
jgi:hypothetical protein